MKKSFEPCFVFVYGTLKKGFSNNDLLGESAYFGDGVTEQDFTLLDNEYFPYMCKPILGRPEAPVYGEYYLIDDKFIMDNIDRLEGIDRDFYNKVKLRVFDLELQDFIEAYAYIASPRTIRRNLHLPLSTLEDTPITPKTTCKVFSWTK